MVGSCLELVWLPVGLELFRGNVFVGKYYFFVDNS